MNRLIGLSVVAVIALYVLFSSIYIVNVREQAIVLRFGQITAVRTEPGLYFKLPTNLVDAVQIIEERTLRYDIANMQLQVSDGATYVVDAFLTYRITDPVKFRERVQGELGLAEQRISTRFDAALRQVYGVRKFDAALSAERSAMMREARDLIRPGMAELGIDVTDVRILRTDLMEDVSKQTFERMSAERNAEAARIRAGGQQAAQSLKAIADRQAVEIVAAARKDSEVLRGEGEALRSEVFASAFTPDPEFFEFYRSMQAYRAALGATGTTMVLAPDSEFFKYFSTDTTDGQPPVPAAPNGIAPLPGITIPADPADALPAGTSGDTPAAEAPLTLDQATPAVGTDGTVVAPNSSEPAPAQ
ncbi:MAG: protease modulator HflC [Devosia nanyangense]|uniref:Protease modulator HflC n=1 Tax=Devosia nanyangense TaxID=1228055 RepID=A0A933L5Q7_9HYPH|nr:protease modulator HflC [Devosia nanyangense]